jgi:Bacterial Ig-like domain (group 2)
MRRRTGSTFGILILAIASLAQLSGCGSTGATNLPPSIAVAVTPTNASVQVGQSLQFMATVQNDPTNKGVSWRVGNSGDTICTAALCGTIDQSGRYTAPAAVSNNPDLARIPVGAVSIADPSKFSDWSLVTITPAPAPAIVVTVSPGNATVQVGQSFQFTATVQNDPANKGVTWHIGSSGNTACTPTLCGTIDANGKYTAPVTVPNNPDLVTIPVGATSVADPSKFSTWSLVTLTPAPDSVLVSPSTATIHIFGVQQFTAAVGSDIPSTGVIWSLSGAGCTGDSCGTIDRNGNYTAPPVVPTPATLTVTATSAAVPTIFGTSAVTIVGGTGTNQELNGQYAFLYKGVYFNNFLTVAGTFTADASGGFANFASSAVFLNGVVDDPPVFRGFNLVDHFHPSSTYSVNADNRGTMTINLANGFPTDEITINLSIALDSFNDSGIATKGRLTSADQSIFGIGYGSGFIVRQDPAAVAASSIDGSYAFGLSGSGTSGLLAAVGRFTASGGNFSAGQADLNNSGTAAMNQVITGTYDASTVPEEGYGTASFTIPGLPPNLEFAFLVVSADELVFIETDNRTTSSSPAMSGVALRQSGGPYSANSLNGPSVFGLTGVSDLSIGLEKFNGNGAFTGTNDENNGGVITANLATAGNYVVDANGLGRGTITLQGGQPRPFYLVAPGEGFIIDMGQSPEAGMFEPQTGGSFDNSFVSGRYAFGSLPSPENFTFALNSGVWTADRAGGLEGQEDSGVVFGGQFSGVYAVASNGRATMMVTPVAGASSNWIMYVISSSRIIAIRIDPGVMPNTIEIIDK